MIKLIRNNSNSFIIAVEDLILVSIGKQDGWIGVIRWCIKEINKNK